MTKLVSSRLATPADVDTLAELRFELFFELGSARESDKAAFVDACRSAYGAMFAAGHGAAWLAESQDGTAVATATLLVFPRLPSPANSALAEGYVVGVFTRRAFRSRGIATSLTSAAVEEARRRGLARIRLHATEAGRRVYASRGFRLRDDEMEIVL
ncbi:MAG TPA: GNAT family N-acetyltransferase [Planctomycetota bacterium]|nr:GNAT family N-acetyltransferase [Planctomycetota bacterium]